MKYTIYLIFIIIFLVLSNNLQAQEFGAPFMKNYTHEDYNADSQNWSITQDNRGIMYFANNSAMIEYDGTNWRKHYLNNKSTIRAVGTDSTGTIFIGGAGEFGYIKPDKIGKLVYTCISDKLENTKKNSIWSIVSINQQTYFFSKYKCFRWYNNELTSFSINILNMKVNKTNNNIYLVTKNGICLLKDTTLVPLKNNILNKYSLINTKILSYPNNKLLIITQNNGLLTYNLTNNTIEEIESEAKKYLIKNELQSGVRIDENQFAIGTNYGGILILNNSSKILRVINENRGLQSNFIFNLYADNNQNLWAAIQKGIAIINTNYPAQQFGKNQNINNYVLDIISFNKKNIWQPTMVCIIFPIMN